MTNLILRLLRERGIVTGDVIPFNRTNLVATMADNHDGKVIIDMGHDVRPGPFWLVSKEDGERLKADGHKLVETGRSPPA